MSETISPLRMEFGRYGSPFVKLDFMRAIKVAELQPNQLTKVATRSLDLSPMEDFWGVEGEVFLAALPWKMRDKMTRPHEPFGIGSTRIDRSLHYASLQIGSMFKVNNWDDFERIYRYVVEILILGRRYYLHCAGGVICKSQIAETLSKSDKQLTTTALEIPVGGGRSTSLGDYLLPQRLADLQTIQVKVVRPPYEIEYAEEPAIQP